MVESIWDVADTEENLATYKLEGDMVLTYAKGKALLRSQPFLGNSEPCHCTQTTNLLYVIPHQSG